MILLGLWLSICLASMDLNLKKLCFFFFFFFLTVCMIFWVWVIFSALFFETSSCNFVRVNFTLNVAVLPVINFWLTQFGLALCLNVCSFVFFGCGREDMVSKYSEIPVWGTTWLVNANQENARINLRTLSSGIWRNLRFWSKYLE